MEVFDCPVCLDNIYFDNKRKMLYSDLCNHRLCDRCVEKHLGQLGRGQCPQCRITLTKSNFVEREPEQDLYSSEKEVRKRICAIYNDSREIFPATPEYNDYLEKREDMIYELTFGEDEQKKRNIEMEIKSYEKQNTKRISENADYRTQVEKHKIREIVNKEGNFYEIVKNNLFIRANDSSGQLIHPLQRQFASLFKDETNYETLVSSEGLSKPLNSMIKTENDIPIKRLKTREENLMAERAGGYQIKLVSDRNKAELLLCMFIKVE